MSVEAQAEIPFASVRSHLFWLRMATTVCVPWVAEVLCSSARSGWMRIASRNSASTSSAHEGDAEVVMVAARAGFRRIASRYAASASGDLPLTSRNQLLRERAAVRPVRCSQHRRVPGLDARVSR
jgi:hypothetical protein